MAKIVKCKKELPKGINKGKYQNIVTLDGDLQNDPKDLINFFKIYFNDDDLKLLGGIRKKRKDIYIKKMSSFIANKVRKFFLNDE